MVDRKKGQKTEEVLWCEVVHHADVLSDMLSSSLDGTNGLNSIYPIPRGGLPIAALLSHRLNLPIVEKDGININTLIVDDIIDSGKTWEEFTEGFYNKFKQEPVIAAIFQRRSSSVTGDFIAEILNHDKWIVFPWEVKE